MTAKKLYEQYRKQQEKYEKEFQIELIKYRLGVPIPTSYDLWCALHCYLEGLENNGGDQDDNI